MKSGAHKHFSRLCLLSFLVISMVATAQDTLDQVLSKLKASKTSRYAYSEVREMALLQKPWTGDGVMFITPAQMLIQQRTPAKTLILITGKDLRYAEPERNIYLHNTLDDSTMGSGPGAFLSFIYGDYNSDSLDADYDTHFSTSLQDWILRLNPRDQIKMKTIEIKGLTGKGANQIRLEYGDGDSTIWSLDLELQGESVDEELKQVLLILDSIEMSPSSDER